MKKEKFIAIAVLAAMLVGCSQNDTAEEITSTASVTSETVKKAAEAEEPQSPTVVPADEVYDVYPMAA